MPVRWQTTLLRMAEQAELTHVLDAGPEMQSRLSMSALQGTGILIPSLESGSGSVLRGR